MNVALAFKLTDRFPNVIFESNSKNQTFAFQFLSTTALTAFSGIFSKSKLVTLNNNCYTSSNEYDLQAVISVHL
jgi:hypothetical protein